MLKKILLSASTLALKITSFAQTPTEIPVGYTNITELSFNKSPFDLGKPFSYGIQTINGIQINQLFFTGLGLGFERTDGAGHIMPVFVDGRFYLGTNKIKPFIDQTLGYTFHLYAPDFTETFNTKGFYATSTSVGVAIPVKFAQAFNVSIGHRLLYRKMKFTFDERSFSLNFITLKTGLTF